MGFIQQKSSKKNVFRARNIVKALMKKGSRHHAELSLIELSLRSRSVDFSKILAQVDGMIKVLGEEQKDDDHMKSYCDKEMTKTGSEIKATSEALESSEEAIKEMTKTGSEIKA